jgi:colanic acid biosynthesis glycosyl transferase WcaI
MNIQLWTCYYGPEPTGNAPVTTMLAESLRDLGHDVLVVAAHPHYPEPRWGMPKWPYRDRRAGVSIVRLPLWPGLDGGFQRLRHDLSFVAVQSMVAPFLPTPDVLVAVTPSFPAIAPAMAYAKVHRIPWILWVQDVVTDAAATTGQLKEGALLRAARRFERATYSSASRIVVISETFRANLLCKGVAGEKLVRIFNSSTLRAEDPNDAASLASRRTPQILAMGNIGLSQGLDGIVDAFQDDSALRDLDAVMVIAGSGVAADTVRACIRDDRVTMPGVVHAAELDSVLRASAIGLVSQRADVTEFNLPSKLMNYMAYGIPVIASVRPESETARIVHESGAGWATDSARPEEFAEKAAHVLQRPDLLRTAGRAGFAFARDNFRPQQVAEQFAGVMADARARPRRGARVG